jgi:hypothetical protein
LLIGDYLLGKFSPIKLSDAGERYVMLSFMVENLHMIILTRVKNACRQTISCAGRKRDARVTLRSGLSLESQARCLRFKT